MIPIIRLFNPKGPDRVAVVSVQAAWAKPGQYNVQVARGPRRSKLAVGVAFGPFTEDELPQRHAAVLHDLRQEGFVRAGLTALTQALMAGDPKKRAHAATRLGWLGDAAAVPQLILTAEQQGAQPMAVAMRVPMAIPCPAVSRNSSARQAAPRSSGAMSNIVIPRSPRPVSPGLSPRRADSAALRRAGKRRDCGIIAVFAPFRKICRKLSGSGNNGRSRWINALTQCLCVSAAPCASRVRAACSARLA